jgi:hypothetical protein
MSSERVEGLPFAAAGRVLLLVFVIVVLSFSVWCARSMVATEAGNRTNASVAALRVPTNMTGCALIHRQSDGRYFIVTTSSSRGDLNEWIVEDRIYLHGVPNGTKDGEAYTCWHDSRGSS